MSSFDVVVVGAGITGLTAAHEILRTRPGARVAVVESAGRVGGKIRTTTFAGKPVDWAADAFLARVPEGIELCRELGLADELVSPAARSAFVYSRGALRPFPTGTVLGVPTDLEALAASGVVSPDGVARAELDLTLGGSPWQGDESVGALVRRRMGDEVFERLVAPLLGGVNAGDADELSVEAGAPQLAAAVREQPSLITGLRSQLRGGAAGPDAPVFFGLPTGTQTLTDALALSITAAGGDIVLSQPATTIRRAPSGAGWRVEGATQHFDGAAVVVTTPDAITASLVSALVPEVSAQLAAVEYASVVMVALAVSRRDIEHELDGSGFLVARPEGMLLTACSWASSKWAHLADPDVVVLRASAGRHDDRRALGLGDDELVAALLHDLEASMGLRGQPIEARVSRWPDALPQFRPGHLDRVHQWSEQMATECAGVIAVGAGLGGLGLPACIRQAKQAARAVSGRF